MPGGRGVLREPHPAVHASRRASSMSDTRSRRMQCRSLSGARLREVKKQGVCVRTQWMHIDPGPGLRHGADRAEPSRPGLAVHSRRRDVTVEPGVASAEVEEFADPGAGTTLLKREIGAEKGRESQKEQPDRATGTVTSGSMPSVRNLFRFEGFSATGRAEIYYITFIQVGPWHYRTVMQR